jgi:hypothetical protein
MSNGQWSTEEDKQLRDLARAGLSLAEIAQRMKRNKSSVRYRALRSDIAIARDRNAMQAPANPSVDTSTSG